MGRDNLVDDPPKRAAPFAFCRSKRNSALSSEPDENNGRRYGRPSAPQASGRAARYDSNAADSRRRVRVTCPTRSLGRGSVAPARSESPTQADAFFDRVSERAIERDDLGIRATNLQIYFGTTTREKRRFCGSDQRGSHASSARRRADGEAMQPTPHAVVSGHHGSNESAVQMGDQEQLGLNPHLSVDHLGRHVVTRLLWKGLRPEVDDRGAIGFSKRSDLECHATRVLERHANCAASFAVGADADLSRAESAV